MIRMIRRVRMVMMIRMIGWSAGLVRMIRIIINNVMFIKDFLCKTIVLPTNHLKNTGG